MTTAEPNRVRVALGERSYEIVIGGGVLAQAARHVKAAGLGGRGVIITDANVESLYAAPLQAALHARGIETALLSVPAGEASKSLAQAARLLERLPACGLDRGSFVMAVGGGMIGDLAGFVAGIYLRGLALVQVPTTLLAQVDSSVGGKTGVNLPQGKNLVGVFHQPRLVLADTEVLRSLPARELRAGYAEVIKYGAICDADFFSWLERETTAALQLEPAAILRVVRRCCEIKAAVVSQDERESGLRAILNFGHTIGHALEAVSDYRGWLHGEAVAVGMCVAARLSARGGGLPATEAQRLERLIGASGLPTRLPATVEWSALWEAMRLDKKAQGGRVRFVLLKRLGEAVVSDAVSEAQVREVLDECRG